MLTEVAQAEKGTQATTHWNEVLRAANEGLRLAGEGDASWLTTKLEALSGLGRDAEALEVARALTARPDATAAHWLMRARLAWKLAGESPTDEVRHLSTPPPVWPHRMPLLSPRARNCWRS